MNPSDKFYDIYIRIDLDPRHSDIIISNRLSAKIGPGLINYGSSVSRIGEAVYQQINPISLMVHTNAGYKFYNRFL